MRMPSVLITGAAGFIGSHLARRKLAEGWDVHVLVRPGADLWRLSPDLGRLGVHRIDLADEDAVAACLRAAAPRHVFHLASETRRPRAADLSDALGSVESEVKPLLVLVRAAASCPSLPDLLIRAGSLAEYGFASAPPPETRRECPADPYAAGKVAGTHYLQMLQPRLPFAAMTARLGLVYGPRQTESFFVGSAIAAGARGEAIRVRRPADRRDLVHVDDVLNALDILSARPSAGAIVNVGSGEAPTMLEIARTIAAACGRPDLIAADGTQGPPQHLMLDTGALARDWGWRAGIPFRAGLASTVAAAMRDPLKMDGMGA